MPFYSGIATVNSTGIVRKSFYDAQTDFGFVGDLVTVFDGAASTGAPTKITSASLNFNANAIVGQRITLAGAGAGGAMYVGTITAIDSGVQVTVSPSISTTVTNRGLQVGTDNTAAITAMVSTINSSTFGAKVFFGTSKTNAYGFPIRVVLNKTAHIEGIGGGHTADSGDYTQIGGTRLAWWGDSADGGVAFGSFWEFSPTGVQAIKRPSMRNLWLDCRNGDQLGANAIIGLKLASCHGFMLSDGFFVCDAGGIGIWTDIDPDPTEAKDATPFSISNLCIRALDNPTGSVTTPFAMTSAVVLSTTPQNLTVAANTLPAAGYIWTMTTAGNPVMVRYTGGGGSTTLTGCTVSTELSIHNPTTLATGNIVQAVPGNSCGILFDGGTGANSCCGTVQTVQISHGTTWGRLRLSSATVIRSYFSRCSSMVVTRQISVLLIEFRNRASD